MIEYILFVIGIALLIKSADYLIEGSSSLAKRFGVSTLVIGLTIVALGTSLPELIVSIIAALNGSGDIVFGNIIGSSMSNTLLILGVMVLITSLKVKSSTTWKEIPFSFLAVLVLFIFAMSSFLNKSGGEFLSRTDGIILLLFFSIFLYYVFELAKKDKEIKKQTKELEIKKQTKELEIKKHSNIIILFMIAGGLIGLFLGGKWTVDGAVAIASAFGLSEFLISATIIAVGTSLPELITSIIAALKKNVDLAVGNIIGSNIFNIFWVLGLTAIIRPLKFPEFIAIDLIILLFATFLLFLFMFTSRKHELDRWEGIVFLFIYVSYIVYLIIRG
jgi:cation:H+ antiporter